MEKKLPETTPFFIIGNPRSGTTLLRLMLNQHDDIVVPPECGFSIWLSDQFADKDFLSNKVKIEFVSQVVKSRKFETWNLTEYEIKEFIQDKQCKSYRDIVLAIYLFYAYKNNNTPHLIGDKNNFYINYLEKIDDLFSSPKFVFIVRDGRDVACSYLALQSIDTRSQYVPRLSNQITEIAEEWTVNNTKILRCLESFPERSFLIKYENLISNPEVELKRSCAFLDIEFQPQMLAYYKNNDEPGDFLAWKQKILQPPDPTNYGMYKKILSFEEIETTERLAEYPLRYFGYL